MSKRISKLSAPEKEIVIRIAEDEPSATCYGTGHKWTKLLMKLAGRCGVEGKHINPDVFRVELPVNQVNLLAMKRRVKSHPVPHLQPKKSSPNP